MYANSTTVVPSLSDKVGNRLQMVVRMVGQTPSCTTTVEYQYDTLDRLTQEMRTVILAAGEFDDGRHYAVNFADGTQQVVAAPRRRPKPSAMAGYGLYALTGVTLMTLLTPIFLIWPRAPGLRRRLRRRRFFTVAVALLMLPCIVIGPKEVQALHHEAALYQIVAALPAVCDQGISTITYQYDANGNMTRRERANNDADVYVYDFENRLTELKRDDNVSQTTQATYDYDADGIRREKTDSLAGGTVTKFLTDKNRPYAQVLEERDGADVHQVWYTYGDDLIAQTRPNAIPGNPSIRRYYLYDGQLSVRQLTDAPVDPNTTPVTITDWYEYDAFGILLDSGGATVNDYRYTGEQYEPNMGFYYLRARYYNQLIGRFLVRDTARGHSSDPLTFHKYLYAGANPSNNVDPSGLSFVSTLSRIAISAVLHSMSFFQLFALYPEIVTIGIVLPFLLDVQTVFTGEQGATPEERAILGAFLLFDVTPAGRILKRIFPTRSLSKIRTWTRALLEEHGQHAPASRRAMIAALQFSEDIVEDSIRVGGKNVDGGDIFARTRSGQTLRREVSVFQGILRNDGQGIYSKIISKVRQVNSAGLQQIFIQVGDGVMEQPNARQLIRESAGAAEELYHGRLKVIIVDSNANQLFPS